MPKEHKSERTERPTFRKLKKAREQGQAPRSTDVPATLVLVGFLAYAHLFGVRWLGRLQEMTIVSFGQIADPELATADIPTLLGSAAATTGMLLAPPLGVLAAAGLAGNLLQGPPPLSAYPLKPRFGKLNPFQGIKKIVSLRQWVEMLKGLLKMVLFGLVAFTAARDAVLDGFDTPGPGAGGTIYLLGSLTGTVILRVACVAAVLAVLDYLFRQYDHVRGLKMTKKEVKDEHKETEGDPLVRARIRQKQISLARTRMMAEVPKATVVITNPTHVAVALRYRRGETDAPELLAKGRALLAERIREIAVAHRVPIVEDPPLARALYRAVPVGGQIPPSLFRAVAEVLALVLSRRAGRRAARPAGEARP
jgi:flagellar biosynthetic protein FlhB